MVRFNWNQNDPSVVNNERLLFFIRGNPVPMPRPRVVHGSLRTGRNHFFGRAGVRFYNPAAGHIRDFQQAMTRMLDTLQVDQSPFVFNRSVPLKIRVVFHIPRPGYHFTSNTGTIAPHYQGTSIPRRQGDLDNYAKFVLDAMNGIVYGDDTQVMILVAMKLNDNDLANGGRTEIDVTVCRNDTLSLAAILHDADGADE